jgi:hypothetical protein
MFEPGAASRQMARLSSLILTRSRTPPMTGLHRRARIRSAIAVLPERSLETDRAALAHARATF